MQLAHKEFKGRSALLVQPEPLEPMALMALRVPQGQRAPEFKE